MHFVNAAFTFISLIVGMGCATGIITSWFAYRSKAMKQLPSEDLLLRLNEISDRLSHLDGSVDTMAIEVERISEAQRFTARVLAERTAPPPAALSEKLRPSGSVTPH